MKNFAKIFFVTLLVFFSYSCNPNLDIPTPSSGSADFTTTVALGGGYLCGYQNGALSKSGQEKCIANLLAEQFKLLGGESFEQPYMPDDIGLGLNSRPWESVYVSASYLGDKTDCEGVTSLSPLKKLMSASDANPYLQAAAGTNKNYAVPFVTTTDISNVAIQNVYYNRISKNLGVANLLIEANNTAHTFSIMWLGMEDIYEYARFGGYNKTIPTTSTFATNIDNIVNTLTSTGKTKGVIASIPDIEYFPYYRYVDPHSVDLDQHLCDSLNQATGNIFNYKVGKNGFAIEYPKQSGMYRQMTTYECVLLNVPSDSLKCYKMGVFYGMPDRYVLDSMELQTIKTAIREYNVEIKKVAERYGIAFVDVSDFYQQLQSGILYNGVSFTNTFISGGFFSLDGFYPNQKGYSMLSNEFVKAINLKYGASVPTVNCKDCDGIKFP